MTGRRRFRDWVWMGGCLLQLACVSTPTVVSDRPRTCATGFQELASGACLTTPQAERATGLVLYLHGSYNDAEPAAEWRQEELVGQAFAKDGLAVVAPRGDVGLCDWSRDLAGWRCWPSMAAQKPRMGQLLVSTLGPALKEARAAIGANVPLCVFGFSNGGMFAGLLASDTNIGASGYVVAQGGLVEPENFRQRPPLPALLLASEDDAWHFQSTTRLHERLKEASWPVEFRQRRGPHALTPEDVTAAAAFCRGVVDGAR